MDADLHPASMPSTRQILCARLSTRQSVTDFSFHKERKKRGHHDGDASRCPGIAAVTGRPRAWYPLTEGPVIDLDVLPSGQVTDAAVDRLLRLRRGEQVELRSGRDPWPVWQRMDDLVPGRYGFAYLKEGPDQWRVQVTRRPGG